MNKVEEVARAMCKLEWHDPDALMFPIKVPMIGPKGYIAECGTAGQAFPAWWLFTDQAKAAIQALRTPNATILKILREGLVMDGYEPHPGQPEKIWDRCIDALLEGDS